jgi:hypothetical protein
VNDGDTVERFTSGTIEGESMVNNWDSFQVRPVDEPTVDLFFADGWGKPQTYPLGDYRDLNSNRTNAVRGVTIPCGVTVEAFTCDDYSNCGESPGQWVLVGPMSTAAIGGALGQQDWDSMRIHLDGSECD